MSETITVGKVIKQKFTNFVRFCETYLQMKEEDLSDLKKLEQLGPELLIATLREVLIPCSKAIKAEDVKLLESQLAELVSDERRRDSLLLPLRAANHDQSIRLWRYLNCFLELTTQQ